MFGPKRKVGEKTFKHIDPPVTQETYDDFVRNLKHLKKVVRPNASKEVMILAEGGDFSENAGYQAAKGKLRGINSRILELEDRIRKAKIISKPTDNAFVELGHTVTILFGSKENTYKILGSTESNPSIGIISQDSPIGSALLGKKIDEEFTITINKKKISCKILKIK